MILKLRRKLKSLSFSGTSKILSWLNTYIYKITFIVIILITIGNNLFAQTLNAEELRSKVIFNSLTDNEQFPYVHIYEEGPLIEESTSQIISYLEDDVIASDQFIEAPYAPGTDDDNIYATAGEESAIIAPIITDTNILEPTRRDKVIVYTVESGDNISGISVKLGVNVNTILWQNDLTWNSTIRPGQELTILPVNGISHTIKSGDTISKLAKTYQVTESDIVTHNKLSDASDISIGEVLIIPDGIKPTAVALQPRTARNLGSVIKEIFVPSTASTDDSGKLLWPLNGSRITQYFHLRHKGIDIGDSYGNPIFAAESGKVERSGWTTGYGYNIIVNHGSGLKTLYAHASKLLVNAGDSVSRGQQIAQIGSTGWSTGPHLHFEVISNGRVTNPLNYVR